MSAATTRSLTDRRSHDATLPVIGSVVIPAHDEAQVIRRCLEPLRASFEAAELEVIVVCNGCSDDTAAVARACGDCVQVIELPEASKPAALRAGDAATSAFPRLYVDADVVLPGSSARRVMERLQTGSLAARPPIRYDASRSSAPVRSYYRARSRIPAVMGSLWGAGVIGLSAAARQRFDTFPDVVADDLWLDRQFDPGEIDIVDCPPVVVAAPRRSRDLLRILRRTYRGKSDTDVDGFDHRAHAITMATLRDLRSLVAEGPLSAIDAAIYAAFALGARVTLVFAFLRRRGVRASHWERDDSSRRS